MQDFLKTCIYFHFSHSNYRDTDNYNSISGFLVNQKEIAHILDSIVYPIHPDDKLKNELVNIEFSQLLIISSVPGLIKPVFTQILKKIGKTKVLIKTLRPEDFGISNGSGTEKSKAVILSAIYRKDYHDIIRKKVKVKSKKTLVIGGGIAGIQASLEIANSGNQVILVEKTGTIGGHMAMFDKTFPTLDCAACILTPKMVDVGQHPNIKLYTLSEVTKLEGEAGNFTVTVTRHARRVDESKCIGCGTCNEKCPGKAQSEFDNGTSLRKAIYIPFPQAVPNKYLVDPESCIYVQKGKCRLCEKLCPVDNCINLDEKDQEIEFHVGHIVVATGFEPFDPSVIKQYGYGSYPNVLTSLELERLVNSAGPTGGTIRVRTQDKNGNWIFSGESREPESFSIIHCIGSRDENYNSYCSRVCCMYSLKLSHLILEKIPNAVIYEHYIDMRAYGKGYEEFYERISNEGIQLIKGKVATIKENAGKLKIRSEDILQNKILEYQVDMVILSVGMQPGKDNLKLAEILDLNFSPDGWFQEKHHVISSEGTFMPGIYLAGTCQGPKDIPDSVIQAAAAASHIIQSNLSENTWQNEKHLSLEIITQKIKESPVHHTN